MCEGGWERPCVHLFSRLPEAASSSKSKKGQDTTSWDSALIMNDRDPVVPNLRFGMTGPDNGTYMSQCRTHQTVPEVRSLKRIPRIQQSLTELTSTRTRNGVGPPGDGSRLLQVTKRVRLLQVVGTPIRSPQSPRTPGTQILWRGRTLIWSRGLKSGFEGPVGL